MKEFWSEVSDIETAKIRILDKEFMFDKKLSKIDFSNKIILDFGCGIGRNLKYLINHTNAKEIIGFDFPNMIKLAKDFLTKEEFQKVLFISPPLPNLSENVDIILAIVVLQHIDTIRELEECLIKLRSFLKDDGMIYIHSRGYIDASTGIDDTKEDRNIWHHILKYFNPISYLNSEDSTENHQQVFFKIKMEA